MGRIGPAGQIGRIEPVAAAHLNERLMRFLSATVEQQEAIDQILGLAPRLPAPDAPTTKGPLLLRVKDAAELLGVHRATIWRLVKAGRLGTVELLGSLRVRRQDVEGLAHAEARRTRRGDK